MQHDRDDGGAGGTDGATWRPLNYVATGAMDFASSCTGLGISLLATHGEAFQVKHPYFWLALLFAVGGFGTGFGSIYLSRLSDRFGRKPMILISVAGLAATSLVLAAASAWWHLFAIVVLRTAFMGIYWPSVEARITDGAEGPEMTRRLGFFGISFCVGFLLGQPVGGILSDSGLRSPFFASAAVCVGLLALLAGIFRHDRAHDGHFAARPHAREINDETRRHGQRIAAAFMLAAWIANSLGYAAASVLRNIFPRFATLKPDDGGLGLSGFQTGVIIGATVLAMLVVFVLLGRFHFWHYKFRYLVISQVLLVAGCATFAWRSEAWALMVASFVYGIGHGLIYLSSIYYSLEGQTARAGQSGLHEGILCFGISGGMLITAVATRYLHSHRTPYWVCVALLLGGMAVQCIVVAGAKRGIGIEPQPAGAEPAPGG